MPGPDPLPPYPRRHAVQRRRPVVPPVHDHLRSQLDDALALRAQPRAQPTWAPCSRPGPRWLASPVSRCRVLSEVDPLLACDLEHIAERDSAVCGWRRAVLGDPVETFRE